jgi:hypothetical protein
VKVVVLWGSASWSVTGSGTNIVICVKHVLLPLVLHERMTWATRALAQRILYGLATQWRNIYRHYTTCTKELFMDFRGVIYSHTLSIFKLETSHCVFAWCSSFQDQKKYAYWSKVSYISQNEKVDHQQWIDPKI